MIIHYNEFYNEILKNSKKWADLFAFDRIVLIEDLEGILKILAFSDDPKIENNLSESIKSLDPKEIFFKGEFWISNSRTSKTDKEFYNSIWLESEIFDVKVKDKVRFLSRVRNRGYWFLDQEKPIWENANGNPRIIVFYSFKGGVGRTTSLAYIALQLALKKKKVTVIDADLDAPGIGTLFSSENEGSNLGLIDYLIETKIYNDYPLSDYYHNFTVEEGNDITVFSAGRIDSNYLEKLARLDFEPESLQSEFPLQNLLKRIKSELNPDYILIDGRAGLSDSSGMLLNGFAHLYVLLGTVSEQSWKGLEYVVQRLGENRIIKGLSQRNCILVQTMVPRSSESKHFVSERFASYADQLFRTKYYHRNETLNEWSVIDMSLPEAPHKPIVIRYAEELVTFRKLRDVLVDFIKNDDYEPLLKRIESRFSKRA